MSGSRKPHKIFSHANKSWFKVYWYEMLKTLKVWSDEKEFTEMIWPVSLWLQDNGDTAVSTTTARDRKYSSDSHTSRSVSTPDTGLENGE
jgi:hypothetical protein